MKPTKRGQAELSFEEAFAALETAVSRLEAGNLSLEESVALYEEGLRLAKLCGQRLDAAELKLSRLVSNADGEGTEVPLGETP